MYLVAFSSMQILISLWPHPLHAALKDHIVFKSESYLSSQEQHYIILLKSFSISFYKKLFLPLANVTKVFPLT